MQSEYELLNRAQPSNSQTKPPETDTNPISAQTSITVREPTTTTLKGSRYALLAFILYSVFALTSWIIICITSRRPLKGQSSYTSLMAVNTRENMRYNEKIIRVAEVLHTVAALLTIPITSAICSIAFVVYMQSGGMSRSLNLEQLMALADQGWISPRIWARIVQVGSAPLYVAFVLTVIGSMAQILQTSFFDREIIRVPERSSTYNPNSLSVKDIPAMFASEDRVGREKGDQVYSLRNMLDTISPNDVDVHLWGLNVKQSEWKLSYLDPSSISSYSQKELQQFQERVPFFSELPSNFSTGLVGRQYAPRINSTTNVTSLTDDEFTTGCQNSTDNGGFYVQYQKTYGYVTRDYIRFTLTACMPGDKRYSPWRETRDRQDIKEELYLNITIGTYSRNPFLFKVTTNSTLGYFELPSQWNNNVFGPLLDKDPYPNGKLPRYKEIMENSKRDLRNISDSGNSTLITVSNPGPLTLLADALFGNGSFIETRIRNPEAFTETRPNFENGGRRENTWMCKGLYPMGIALGMSCISDYDLQSADGPIWSWLAKLTDTERTLQKAMIYGVWAANKNWLGPLNSRFNGRQVNTVFYNEGFETSKPKISTAGIIVGSVFLGLHLLGLFVMAIVIAFTKTWTKTLGAEAMVQVGMTHAIPLSTAEKAWRKEARNLPGYIGDANPGSEVGRMEMGAREGLRSKNRRKYELLR